MPELTPHSHAPLQLRGRQPFGRGGKRDCFVHPHHPDRCVKVARQGCEPETLRMQSPWWRRWRKSVRDYDESFSDWRVFQWLEKMNDPSVWDHLPRCHGWTDTDLGPGFVIELIRDADGLISRSFLDYLWTHGYDERARQGMDALARFWEARTIPSRSLGLHNMAAQLRADGTMRLVVIDGFGRTTIFPQLNRSGALARSRRKMASVRQTIEETLERKQKGADPGKFGFLLSRQ